MFLALGHRGPGSGVLCCMDDLICVNHTVELILGVPTIDGPNPKLNSPWHGPYTVRARLSPIIYHISKDNEPAATTVHLGRIKKYTDTNSSFAPNLETLDDKFLGTILPVPDLEARTRTSRKRVTIGPYTVEYIDGHKRG